MVLHKHSLDAGALAAFAEQLDLVLAAHSTSLAERERGVYATGPGSRTRDLSQLSGAQFDRQFAEDMATDHKEDIGKFQKQAKSKGPLGDFAQQTIPTLQKHLQTAESLTSQTSRR